MPAIEEVHDEAEANRIYNYWRDQLIRMGATSIAGVYMKQTNRKPGRETWEVGVELYVSEDSEAYRNFMREWRG